MIIYRRSLKKWIAKVEYTVRSFDHWDQVPSNENTSQVDYVHDAYRHMLKWTHRMCKSENHPEKLAYLDEFLHLLETAKENKLRSLNPVLRIPK